jgi:hypothetical protein
MLEVCLECSGLFFAPKEGITKLLALPREELAIEIIERVFAPEGLRDSARGFNPGNRPKPHRALQGRHIDWPNNVKKTMYPASVSARTSTSDSSRF